MDTNPPVSIYTNMWKYYCEKEISLLQPDIIIGVGNDVYAAIKRNLRPELNIRIIKIPFPGRLNLNSKFIPLGKRLIKDKEYNPVDDISRFWTTPGTRVVMETFPVPGWKPAKTKEINNRSYYLYIMPPEKTES